MMDASSTTYLEDWSFEYSHIIKCSRVGVTYEHSSDLCGVLANQPENIEKLQTFSISAFTRSAQWRLNALMMLEL